MAFTFNGFILGGRGAIDGNMDGNPDGLEFALGTNPITSLIGGRKTTDSGGALDPLGAGSVTIISGALISNMVGGGVNSVCVGHDCSAAGDNTIALGTGAGDGSTTSNYICLGNGAGAGGSIAADAICIGRFSVGISERSIQLGVAATSSSGGIDTVAIGTNTFSNATNSIALGGDSVTGASANASNTFVCGAEMSEDGITDTWTFRGFGMVPRALAITDWERLAGAQIVLESPLSNGLSLNNQRFDFPSDVHFLCDEVDIDVVNLDGTIDTQATVRAGNRNVGDTTGDDEFFFLSTIGVDLDVEFDRDSKGALLNNAGVISVSGGVSTIGAIGAGSATVYELRYAFKGRLVRDE